MPFRDLPGTAAWRHGDGREGFEVVSITVSDADYRLDGHTAAVEDGQAWVVRYVISLDEDWVTTGARVWGWSSTGQRELRVESHGPGRWHVNGTPAPEYDGCIDVDLESSSVTNTIPVHRLELAVGQSAEVPAVYVRALDLGVARLDQHYLRVDDDGGHQRYDYRAPDFGFTSQLTYDEFGLVLEYPGIASRVL
jgi:hypothetical protein